MGSATLVAAKGRVVDHGDGQVCEADGDAVVSDDGAAVFAPLPEAEVLLAEGGVLPLDRVLLHESGEFLTAHDRIAHLEELLDGEARRPVGREGGFPGLVVGCQEGRVDEGSELGMAFEDVGVWILKVVVSTDDVEGSFGLVGEDVSGGFDPVTGAGALGWRADCDLIDEIVDIENVGMEAGNPGVDRGPLELGIASGRRLEVGEMPFVLAEGTAFLGLAKRVVVGRPEDAEPVRGAAAGTAVEDEVLDLVGDVEGCAEVVGDVELTAVGVVDEALDLADGSEGGLAATARSEDDCAGVEVFGRHEGGEVGVERGVEERETEDEAGHVVEVGGGPFADLIVDLGEGVTSR